MGAVKVKFFVSYDGTDFCGWQRQGPEALPSVQETLDQALAQLFQRKITLFASGRTDAGVHALAQVCHFDIDISEEKLRSRDLCWALRGILPPSISVRKAWIAPDEFHATLSATHKTYKYFIYNHRRSNPFLRRTSHWARFPLDLAHLQASSQYLLGKQDFKSFKSQGSTVKTTVRTIMEARWERKTPHMLEFTITGQGFLKQMVRNIVGTQLKLEKEKRDPAEMATIIAAQDRTKAGAPAPPQGLFLWRVFYPTHLDKQCRPL